MRKNGFLLMLPLVAVSLGSCAVNRRLLSSNSASDSSFPSSSSSPNTSNPPQGPSSSVDEDQVGYIPVNYGGTIQYGFYPQWVVSRPDLISALERGDGVTYGDSEYCQYEGGWFYKAAADTQDQDSYFTNEERIVPGQSYWFYCRPIVWIILEETQDGYLCLSEEVLEAWMFNGFYDGKINDHYANAWEDSALREYCNGKFIDWAFHLSNPDKYLIPQVIDNSPETTDSPNNEVNGRSTEDLSFPLCYQDFCHYRYAFSEEDPFKRTGYATDYARARGVRFVSNWGGYFWTRSPADGYKEVWCITSDGHFERVFCEDMTVGVRPAIFIAK
ncbi:MAG: hypothetical protein J5736_03275 [Bacilli bacterium]|nr:hypothetical protein [Bacilli bacterium]